MRASKQASFPTSCCYCEFQASKQIDLRRQPVLPSSAAVASSSSSSSTTSSSSSSVKNWGLTRASCCWIGFLQLLQRLHLPSIQNLPLFQYWSLNSTLLLPSWKTRTSKQSSPQAIFLQSINASFWFFFCFLGRWVGVFFFFVGLLQSTLWIRFSSQSSLPSHPCAKHKHTHTHTHTHTHKQKPHKLPILSSSKIQLKTKTKKASKKERQATKLQRKLPKANKRDWVIFFLIKRKQKKRKPQNLSLTVMVVGR